MEEKSILPNIFEESRSTYKEISAIRNEPRPESLDEATLQDGILEVYSEYLDGVVKDHQAANLLIHGNHGLGKTMVTEMLLPEYKKNNHDEAKFEYVYVCCNPNSKDIEFIRAIIRELEAKLNVKKHFRQSKDIGKNLNRIVELVQQTSSPVIIVLDDIDFTKSMDLIIMLANVKDIGPCANNISLICITSETKIKDENKLKNFFNRELKFAPYNSDQITSILTEYVCKTYVDGFVDKTVITECAAHSIKDLGSDIKSTIYLLRSACVKAKEEDAEKATDIHVHKVIDIKNNSQNAMHESLNIEDKIALLSIIKRKNKSRKYVTANDIFYTYTQVATFLNKGFINFIKLQRILTGLETMGFLTKRRILEDHGRAMSYAPKMPETELANMLYQDNDVAPLKDYKVEY